MGTNPKDVSANRFQGTKTTLTNDETETQISNDELNILLAADTESTSYIENDGLVEQSNERKDKDNLAVAPDGGWGWVVVFGSFLAHFIFDGILFSFGIFYVEFLDYYKGSKGETAWISSLMIGFQLFTGLLASVLTKKFGCRLPTIIGAVVTALGFVLSIFSPNLYFLYFSFGTISGTGIGLMYLPAVVSVGYYFEKKRTFAVGLASCGSGIGAFILNPVSKYLIDLYAWRGAILIEAGILLNCVLCGALFRPLQQKKHSSPTGAEEEPPVIKGNTAGLIDAYEMQSSVNQSLLGSSSLPVSAKGDSKEGKMEPFGNDDPSHFRMNENERRFMSGDSIIQNHQQGDKIKLTQRQRFFNIIENVIHSMGEIFDLSPLRDVMFIVYLVSNILVSLCVGVPFAFLYDRAVDQGIDTESAKWLGSVIGISNIVGKVAGGLLADKLEINRLLLFNITITVCGISVALCPLCFNYTLLVICTCAFGISFGIYVPLMSVVLVDLLGVEMLTSSFGLMLMFKGIANVIGLPIAGWLYDGTGSYDLPFIAAGTTMIAGGILLYFSTWVRRCSKNVKCEKGNPS